MISTQSEINLFAATQRPLSSIADLDQVMQKSVDFSEVGLPVVSGKHVIDGHHRLASIISVNPSAMVHVIDLGIPARDPDKKLGIVQLAIAQQPELATEKLPQARGKSSKDNVFNLSKKEIFEKIMDKSGKRTDFGKYLSDDIVNHILSKYANKLGLTGKESVDKAREKIAKKVAANIGSIKSSEGPSRKFMPQVNSGNSIDLNTNKVISDIVSGKADFKDMLSISESTMVTLESVLDL